MPEILFPEWRNQQDATRYPFAAVASLVNTQGKTIVEGTFIDAVLYPVGGAAGMYLSNITVTYQMITLTIGDADNAALASGSFSVSSPPDNVLLSDVYGRPAGLLISQAVRLGSLAALGVGTYNFAANQTEFAATVCIPTPQIGVQGFLLADGTMLSGQMLLVGSSGIVLSSPQAGNIRVDAIGDPLFTRALCQNTAEGFTTPVFILTITFTDDYGHTVVVRPDATGNVMIVSNDAIVDDPVLRVIPVAGGTLFEAIGSTTNTTVAV